MYEGQIVRDEQSGAIYRLSGGYKLHFPNMGTYQAHGSPAFTNYNTWLLAAIPQGPNIYPTGVSEGQVVRDPNSGAIYRLINGRKSHYPNMEVYTAHGKPAFTNVDSTLLSHIIDGPTMNGAGITEGSVIRDKASGAIYRVMNGHKHHYPNMPVYQAHGSPAFTDYESWQLSGIPEGPSILPPGFYDGQVVRNPQSGAIYRLANGRKSHYPNMNVYQAHGSPAYVDHDPNVLNNIPDGPAY